MTSNSCRQPTNYQSRKPTTVFLATAVELSGPLVFLLEVVGGYIFTPKRALKSIRLRSIGIFFVSKYSSVAFRAPFQWP